MSASRLPHIIKRAIQIVAVFITLTAVLEAYFDYRGRLAYDLTPQGKAQIASKEANAEAKKNNIKAKQLAGIKIASNYEAMRIANIETTANRRTQYLANRTETNALADKAKMEQKAMAIDTEAKMQARNNQRMQEYAYGKQALKMSLKDPVTF